MPANPRARPYALAAFRRRIRSSSSRCARSGSRSASAKRASAAARSAGVSLQTSVGENAGWYRAAMTGARYRVARIFGVRPAGVPFDVLDRLGTPAVAEAARRLAALEAQVGIAA